MLTLYDYYRSSAAYRVRIALNIKGCEYDVNSIHLLKNGGEQFSSDYKRINPLSLVPSLQDDKLILTESLAIIEYLDEKFPAPPLLPKNIEDKARVRAFALTIAADTHPLCNLRVNNYLMKEFHITEDQRKQWIQHWINIGLTALETQLTNNHFTGKYCFGNTPTLADICLIPQLFSAQRFECDLSRFPTLMRINDNCNEIDAFSNAYPVEPVTP
jgi:maleylpyruvate isomerase